MQLTQFSDYALRVGLYLAMHPDRRVSVDEMSRAYAISREHLAKVASRLVILGVVEATRGRGGGLSLGKPPSAINVGALVRQTEPHLHLVECFDPATNTCPIAPACGLKGVLEQAQNAFLEVLDRYTLADFLVRRDALLRLWAPGKRSIR